MIIALLAQSLSPANMALEATKRRLVAAEEREVELIAKIKKLEAEVSYLKANGPPEETVLQHLLFTSSLLFSSLLPLSFSSLLFSSSLMLSLLSSPLLLFYCDTFTYLIFSYPILFFLSPFLSPSFFSPFFPFFSFFLLSFPICLICANKLCKIASV